MFIAREKDLLLIYIKYIKIQHQYINILTKKWKEGVIPYILPSTSRTLTLLRAHLSNFQNHSIFKVKILFNTINSYMGNLRDIVFILLERNIYIEKVLKFVDPNRNDICCIYAAYPNDYT